MDKLSTSQGRTQDGSSVEQNQKTLPPKPKNLKTSKNLEKNWKSENWVRAANPTGHQVGPPLYLVVIDV